MSHLLLTRKNSFLESKVDFSSPEEVAEIKAFIQAIFSRKGYTKSSSTNVDLDRWSTWFCVRGEAGEILAAMRVVEKRPYNFLPIEQAIICDETPLRRYAVENYNTADWNNVAFSNTREGLKAAKQCFALAARFCIEKNYDMVYGFYDLKNPAIVKLYSKVGILPSEIFPKLVYFPGSTLNGTNVELTIIEITKQTLQNIVSKI
ncbi:hypothetical protein EHO57_14055 [Leptospira langatensis]|uniref:GNAT family N-acetyltransferase n=1 Tax=Leptospira langatensis TaxID=2484983 RepID=A0A5R2ASU1_9LEPT|nr:hypothetical protein [Leptospira langatensis]TGJ99878.1 hypothetical protein EHO57_14055 [Leptospira langatensis]